MSYSLPEAITFEGMIDYATGVAAGLKAVPEIAPLAADWAAARQARRAERDARDDARALAVEATAVVRVRDAAWDDAVKKLSGEAFLAAGKDAGRSPYAPLFGTIKATDATRLGPAKASSFGATLLAKANELATPSLAGAVQALTKENAALGEAGAARAAARDGASVHEVKRQKAREALELLIATTEVGILTAFPGRRDLVRAILAPTRRASVAREDGGDEGDGADGGEAS